MYIRVTVTPGAKEEECAEIGENRFSISVREKAERNLANKRVCQVVATRFNVPVSKVRIISGHHHRTKMLSVDQSSGLV